MSVVTLPEPLTISECMNAVAALRAYANAMPDSHGDAVIEAAWQKLMQGARAFRDTHPEEWAAFEAEATAWKLFQEET